jgi:polyhydroxybutyrate depolymerase
MQRKAEKRGHLSCPIRPMKLALVAALLTAAACNAAPDAAFSTFSGREYILKVPAGLDAAPAALRPLVIVLHGLGGDAADMESFFQLDPLADEQGFFVLYPQGTINLAGQRFFNATDACCDFFESGVDDVAFIDGLIDHIAAEYSIDPARIYVTGHSNGGFMSYRLACDLSPRIAAIVSLEGAMWNDPSHCHPTSPVAVLEVHGTDDVSIDPAGGNVTGGHAGFVYPSVATTLLDWQGFNECGAGATGSSPGEIDSETSGPVNVELWNGCSAAVELWMIEGGTHAPTLTPAWPRAVVDFFMAHPKSSPGSVDAGQ